MLDKPVLKWYYMQAAPMRGRKSPEASEFVPCKLNNAKTNKTPWTINELFKFRV